MCSNCYKKNNTFLKECIICNNLSYDKASIFCLNENDDGKLTCPNNNYNYTCYKCSKEWITKTNTCPICRSSNIQFISQDNDNDIEKNCNIECKCHCSLSNINSIYPENFINKIKNNKCFDNTMKFIKFILFIFLFELTGILVSSIWIYIFICHFDIYKFDDMVFDDLYNEPVYYIICPLVTTSFILVIIFCKNFFNWCNTYDSIAN